jgi:3-oxoadipate enol-lactonase
MLTQAERPGQRRVRRSETLSAGSVQVLGESIYYQASGSAEDGPTILFLHESGGCSATWHGQLTGLADSARCLVPDLPGHGKSEGLGFIRISDYRRAVLEFLDALAIRWPVVVAGVCLGAAVALDLALTNPQRVAGLILAGVAEGGRAGEQCRKAAGAGLAPDEFVRSLFGPHASERLMHGQRLQWRLTSPLVRFGDLEALYCYPFGGKTGLLTRPALLVAGEEDQVATLQAAAAMARSMSGARAVAVPKAGCLSMVEQPAAFNRVVSRFLAELQPAAPIALQGRGRGGYRRF